MLSRLWQGLIATLVVVAVVLQLVIAIRVSGSPHDTTVGLLRGSSLMGRIIRVLSFFTIQSNLLIGATSATLALDPRRDGPVWRALRLASLVGIVVTGVVYSTVLARIHEPHGAGETAVNTIVHYVVPLMAALGWIAFGPRPRVTWHVMWQSLLFPAAWLAYTLIRGAIWGWYPYPFLDVGSHGYATVALNAVLVLVVLSLVTALFALGDRRLPASDRAHSPSTMTPDPVASS